VAHLDTGREWRGGQAQVLTLMRGLKARGHEGLLMAPAGPLLERARGAGFETRLWRARGDWDLVAAWRAGRAVRGAGADLVHCHTARAHALGTMAAHLAGIPAVVSRRVPVVVGRHPLSLLKYRRGVARYLCISRPAMAELERIGVPSERLALVPSGVDLEDFDAPSAGERGTETRSDLRALIGAPPESAVVGTVAALTAEKNPTLMLAAARVILEQRPETHFVWIGEGPCRAELARECHRVGLEHRLHLLGFREDAKELLRQLTLFVLPSSWEGLGTSVLDAQAAGVPVIATRVGGVVELIEDRKNGRLVPSDDRDALVQAIIEALDDPAMRARWVAAARDSVRAFGSEAMVERTLEVYRAVLGERRGTPARP
jgi:glycosyltransferase involved in cell wall biosynthesis